MKRKTISTMLVALSILSLIPLIIELFIFLSIEYMMICSKTDREYIQSISHTNYDFKIAVVKVEGFINPSSDAKIIINNVLPYPTTFGEQKVIESNPDNIKNIISSYIEKNSNKLFVLVVCILPYIFLYTILFVYLKIMKKSNV